MERVGTYFALSRGLDFRSMRRDWGWHPQFDLPATADHLLAGIANLST